MWVGECFSKDVPFKVQNAHAWSGCTGNDDDVRDVKYLMCSWYFFERPFITKDSDNYTMNA